jgi:hypothetical protein
MGTMADDSLCSSPPRAMYTPPFPRAELKVDSSPTLYLLSQNLCANMQSSFKRMVHLLGDILPQRTLRRPAGATKESSFATFGLLSTVSLSTWSAVANVCLSIIPGRPFGGNQMQVMLAFPSDQRLIKGKQSKSNGHSRSRDAILRSIVFGNYFFGGNFCAGSTQLPQRQAFVGVRRLMLQLSCSPELRVSCH